MKRNILFFIALVFVLASCGKTEINESTVSNTKLSEEPKTMTGDIKTDTVKSNNVNEKISLENKKNEDSSGVTNDEIQPTSTVIDNSSDWKTYTNSKLGFHFDYLPSSGFDINKLKVNDWECGEQEKCVELRLPTSDKDFMPYWIKNPTIEDIAKYMNYNVLYVHIIERSKYEMLISKDCLKTKDISAYCNPERYQKGNKVYFSSNEESVYLFDNMYGQPVGQDKPYPSDGIPWSSMKNFKAF